MFSPVLNALLPVLLMVLLGTVLRRSGFLPDSFFSGLNKLVFWVALPCQLYVEISGAQLRGAAAARTALALMVASAAMVPVGRLVARLLRLPAPSARAFIQAAYRGNLAYVGLPVVAFALNHNPDARAAATLALAPTIPFFNVLSVVVLLNPGRERFGRQMRRAAIEIARNPLLIACVLGMAALALHVRLPAAIGRGIEAVGRFSLAGALLALGSTLDWNRVRGHAPRALAAAALKVGGAPLLGVPIALACGVRGDMLTVCLIFLAAPTAVASFVMADQMGADRDLAAAAIVASTLLAFPALAAVLLLT